MKKERKPVRSSLAAGGGELSAEAEQYKVSWSNCHTLAIQVVLLTKQYIFYAF